MGSDRTVGRLMPIGGGEDKQGEMEVLREFVDLAGGPESARILVCSAASSEPEAQDEKYRDVFGRLGVRDFRVLEIESRRDADHTPSAGLVDAATGIFFTGGDQKRLVALLVDSKIDRALHRGLARGLVIAGTSAGASMMSETMLDEGESAECPRKGVIKLGRGLGFLPGMLIDQHFAQRGRLGRLLAVLAEHPEHLAVGIGEDTAMIVEGDTFRVVGRGVVTAIDASKQTYNDHGERRKNQPLTLSNLILHTVGLGHRFDLRERRVIAEESRLAAGPTS